MGDARLWRQAQAVESFNTAELHTLIADMEETMHHLDGVGLAAPQIGVDQRLVIFGFADSPRYPDADSVPYTVLINPLLTPLSDEIEEGWEGCLSVPGLRGLVPRWKSLRYSGFDPYGKPISDRWRGFMRASFSTNAIISTGFCIRCVFEICGNSALPMSSSRMKATFQKSSCWPTKSVITKWLSS